MPAHLLHINRAKPSSLDMREFGTLTGHIVPPHQLASLHSFCNDTKCTAWNENVESVLHPDMYKLLKPLCPEGNTIGLCKNLDSYVFTTQTNNNRGDPDPNELRVLANLKTCQTYLQGQMGGIHEDHKDEGILHIVVPPGNQGKSGNVLHSVLISKHHGLCDANVIPRVSTHNSFIEQLHALAPLDESARVIYRSDKHGLLKGRHITNKKSQDLVKQSLLQMAAVHGAGIYDTPLKLFPELLDLLMLQPDEKEIYITPFGNKAGIAGYYKKKHAKKGVKRVVAFMVGSRDMQHSAPSADCGLQIFTLRTPNKFNIELKDTHTECTDYHSVALNMNMQQWLNTIALSFRIHDIVAKDGLRFLQWCQGENDASAAAAAAGASSGDAKSVQNLLKQLQIGGGDSDASSSKALAPIRGIRSLLSLDEDDEDDDTTTDSEMSDADAAGL